MVATPALTTPPVGRVLFGNTLFVAAQLKLVIKIILIRATWIGVLFFGKFALNIT